MDKHSHQESRLLQSEEFVIRERFHIFILLLAPIIVFIGGLWLVTSPPTDHLGSIFLNSFGGLFLCMGSLFVYAIVLVRRVLRQAPLLEIDAKLASRLPIVEKVRRLSVFFLFFAISWFGQALYGVAGNILFQTIMIVFGMLAVTLTAHFHAHH